MPKKTKFRPKDIAAYVAEWSLDDLEEAKAIISGLIKARQPNEPETSIEPPNSSASKAGRKGGAGYLKTKMINGCGPYNYLRYMRDGKRKSVYVGKG